MVAKPDIRLLTAAELDEAFALSSTAGWNQRLDDWSMLLGMAPGGSFAAVSDGQIVGTAIGVDYGRFGWIAMMLVNPAYRSQGIGAHLLEAAMAAIPGDKPIRLDATPLGRPLYQRYGFDDEQPLTRYTALADATSADPPHEPGSIRVRPMTAADVPAIRTVDAGVFASDRAAVLQWSLDGGAQYAHVIDADPYPHYCFGRHGRLFDQIGPVVAGDAAAARALVAAALPAASGRAVVVDAFDAHGDFTSWLAGRGFVAQRALFRMCRPGTARAAVSDAAARGALTEFAIFGPEFG
jgi:GNAT superfamily N-acetyltransferase